MKASEKIKCCDNPGICCNRSNSIDCKPIIDCIFKSCIFDLDIGRIEELYNKHIGGEK